MLQFHQISKDFDDQNVGVYKAPFSSKNEFKVNVKGYIKQNFIKPREKLMLKFVLRSVHKDISLRQYILR